jgi:phospholipid/cholesterol/gamma-HCH transport system substrate-binding protein
VIPGYSLPDISQITAVADQIAENLAVITERVEVAFTEETALNVQRAIENIQEVSEQLSGVVHSQQRTMDELASNLAETSRAVTGAANTAQRTFAQVDEILADGELNAIVRNVGRASVQLDSLTSVLLHASSDFREVVTAADEAIRSVDRITGQVHDGHGTIGRLLQDTLLYDELIESNAALQDLLRDVQENPRRYIQFRFFGR